LALKAKAEAKFTATREKMTKLIEERLKMMGNMQGQFAAQETKAQTDVRTLVVTFVILRLY
jgi:hypothetical protein